MSAQEVAIRESTNVELPRTANEIRGQVNRIQEVMQSVMKNGVHYGTIPGCGDKPALLKPGAEKLMMTFRMAVDPDVKDLSSPGTCRYRVLARVTSITTGAFLGLGIGECSSDEEKYAWKKVAVEQEWFETDPINRREKWMRGYQKNPNYKIKQVRANPFDVSNTVLKMAKKRALIDAVLTVTAASDIFSQDIEDLDEETTTVEETKAAIPLKDKLKAQLQEPAAVPAQPDSEVPPGSEVPHGGPANLPAASEQEAHKEADRLTLLADHQVFLKNAPTATEGAQRLKEAEESGYFLVHELKTMRAILNGRIAELGKRK